MDTKLFSAGPNGSALVVERVAEGQWHALDDDLVAGRGHAVRRPDGRLFVSIDAWHRAAFDELAAAMLADLPAPLYAVADEAELDLISQWRRVGFTIHRREREFTVPTDPRVTGLEAALPPPGVRIVPAGAAHDGPLHDLYRAIRDEVEAGPGWQTMPAEVRPRPAGAAVADPAHYVVAAAPDRYLGLLRLTALTRRPRIGLIAVRAGEQRRGIARALLSHALGTLHRRGIAAASAEADETNVAALALFEGIASRRTGGRLELAR